MTAANRTATASRLEGKRSPWIHTSRRFHWEQLGRLPDRDRRSSVEGAFFAQLADVERTTSSSRRLDRSSPERDWPPQRCRCARARPRLAKPELPRRKVNIRAGGQIFAVSHRYTDQG
jgi:hypothetical protein